jgi:Fe-S-cluster containining protein
MGNVLVQIETADRKLLSGIAEAMAESARRSGDWLVCRPGCTQCCMGPFAITQLDAHRLRQGLQELDRVDSARAEAVRTRAAAYRAVIAPEYPGNPATGELLDEDRLPRAMDEAPCPVLDPETGYCDLYGARPVTCRTFGPATPVGPNAFAACELCYNGADEEEIAACAVDVDSDGLECELLTAMEEAGFRGMTIVAYALQDRDP